MQGRIRRQLSCANRVADFVKTHPVAEEGYATVVTRLEANVARADVIAEQQVQGQVAEKAARAQRKQLRSSIRGEHLARLVQVAKLAAKTHPEVAGKFKMPTGNLPLKEFLVASKSLLAAAEPHKEVFIPLGIGAAFLDQLGSSIDQYEASTQAAHAGRNDHIEAGKEFVTLVRSFATDIAIIDTYLRGAYPKDSEVYGAWLAAKKVAGPFHRSADVAPVVA